jgi:predicted 3-demethylubiquinone-9 3-methyltransferase (glyoxalase superfamily)
MSSAGRVGRNRRTRFQEDSMQKITTFLWFDNQAEEAANFYTSLFKDSRVVNVHRYGPAGPGDEGSVMLVTFELCGQQFHALNGGPEYRFTPATSLYVDCSSQEEVDELWARFTDGGREVACGWLTDRYGLSWQIVPRRMTELLNDPDPGRADRAMKAMLSMTKLDVAVIEAAADGR